jgi:MFS family permease
MNITTLRNGTWMLGVITFLGFIAAAFGNTIAQKLLDKYGSSQWNVYNLCRIILGVCILVFAFQKGSMGFVIWYTGIYLLLGAGNVAESTLINKLTPNYMRASVLSLNSLAVQIGALCASVFSSLMIFRIQFAGIWIMTGGLLGGYALFVTVFTNKKQVKNQEYNC